MPRLLPGRAVSCAAHNDQGDDRGRVLSRPRPPITASVQPLDPDAGKGCLHEPRIPVGRFDHDHLDHTALYREPVDDGVRRAFVGGTGVRGYQHRRRGLQRRCHTDTRSRGVEHWPLLYSAVLTDLFAVAHELDPAAIEAAIPPSCRRGVTAAPSAVAVGGGALVELAPWRPRHPARHLVPSLSLLTRRSCRFRFEASVRTAGGWSPWVATTTIGGAELPPLPAAGDTLEAQIDFWETSVPAEEVRLRLRCDDAAVLDGAWLVTLSACDLAPRVAPASGGR